MELFLQLDAICGPEVIFASNTSSIPITELATATKEDGQVVGCIFSVPRIS